MATCPSCRKHYENDVAHCADDGEALLADEAFSNADPDLKAGVTVGEYQIEDKLGEGGFGAVYRATHPLIGKTVAIKVLNRQYSSNPQMVSRFIAEARAVNQIRNRNIIDIFSFGSLEDGRQYYVMELLEGQTFNRYLKERGRLPPEEAIPILRGIARALDAAHANGIAHRDLKPENVFLVFEDDGMMFPKLLDFGIAKLTRESRVGHKTRTGTPMGTPYYMSPEQCRGKNVDHRTDVYSFGIVAFEALAGQLPFTGEDIMDVLFKQTSAAPPPLSSVVPDLPADLDVPILEMLDKDPAKRPSSVGDAVERLAEAAIKNGFPIPAAPARTSKRGEGGPGSSSKSGSGFKSGGGISSSFAEARTIAHDPSRATLSAQATDVKKAPGNRGAIFGALGALAVCGLAAALFFGLKGSGAAVAASASTAPTEATVATAATTAAPTVTPASSAIVTPANDHASADVVVSIQAKPATAEVWRGKDKLGAASDPIKLPRGEAQVTLTIKAPGYKPLDVQVTPNANVVMPVNLEKALGKKSGNSDLEF